MLECSPKKPAETRRGERYRLRRKRSRQASERRRQGKKSGLRAERSTARKVDGQQECDRRRGSEKDAGGNSIVVARQAPGKRADRAIGNDRRGKDGEVE